jgi:hypothetical protein
MLLWGAGQSSEGPKKFWTGPLQSAGPFSIEAPGNFVPRIREMTGRNIQKSRKTSGALWRTQVLIERGHETRQRIHLVLSDTVNEDICLING